MSTLRDVQVIESLVPIFLFLILIEFLVARKRNKIVYSLSDSITDMSLGIISRLCDVFVILVVLLVYNKIQSVASLQKWAGASEILFANPFYLIDSFPFFGVYPLILCGWVACFFVLDFLFYWSHRFSHEVNILWASHVVHHSSEEFNLTVALRQSFLRNVITCSFYLPFAILGFPWQMFLITDGLNRLYQFWVHTRLINRVGNVFEYIFVTPSHHRVHHAANPIYIDKNYGGMFIIWDRLFGTFELETEAPIYGITKPLRSYNPVYANVHVFIDIVKDVVSTRLWKERWKVMFSPPGYRPIDVQHIPLTPVHPSTFHKFAVFIDKSPMIMAFLEFVLLIALSLVLIKRYTLFPIWIVALGVAWLLWSYSAVGRRLEDKQIRSAEQWLRFMGFAIILLLIIVF